MTEQEIAEDISGLFQPKTRAHWIRYYRNSIRGIQFDQECLRMAGRPESARDL